MLPVKAVIYSVSGLLSFMPLPWLPLNVLSSAKLSQAALQTAAAASRAIQTDSISLTGVIDFHCHTGPDVTPRSVNDLQLVQLAKQAGMRGIVLKNHYAMTADRAQLAMQEVGGIEVFGGIVLNRSVGGLNAEAVNRMVQFDGHRGKVVWLPTTDAENNFGHQVASGHFVSVLKNGKPVAALMEVLGVIAQNNLVLETGHSSPEESLVIIAAAKKAGINKVVVTHALLLGATINQVKQMVAMGAMIECCWQPGGLPGATEFDKRASVPACVLAMKAIGAKHFIIDSDLGQPGNPVHPVGMQLFMAALEAGGITKHDIHVMACQNPARLLGLDPGL